MYFRWDEAAHQQQRFTKREMGLHEKPAVLHAQSDLKKALGESQGSMMVRSHQVEQPQAVQDRE
jgi:hypothetical protein